MAPARSQRGGRRRPRLGALAAAALALSLGCGGGGDPRARVVVANAPVVPGAWCPDDETVRAPRDLARDVPPINPDGTVNLVVEIPAGTNAKFEVDERDGVLRWERRAGARRVVDYLPYPGNYGFVPGTVAPTAEGGDGDPLDVLLLGPALERGSVVPVRLVGVLRLLDEGEVDDKLLAVRPGEPPFAGVTDVADLARDYPGVLEIVTTWFERYDGPDVTRALGVEDAAAARATLERGRLR